MTPALTLAVLTAPDDAAGPTLRPAGDLTARDLWRWLVAGRMRAALDSGTPQHRVSLVETVLADAAELLADPCASDPDAAPPPPRAVIHAIETADPALLAAVWTARRIRGLPAPAEAVPMIFLAEGPETARALADQMDAPAVAVVAA